MANESRSRRGDEVQRAPERERGIHRVREGVIGRHPRRFESFQRSLAPACHRRSPPRSPLGTKRSLTGAETTNSFAKGFPTVAEVLGAQHLVPNGVRALREEHAKAQVLPLLAERIKIEQGKRT